MIALDSNLFIYAHRAATPEHKQAQAAIEEACSKARCGMALPCLAEFWSIVTHPKSSGGPSTPAQAQQFIEKLMSSGEIEIWQPGSSFPARLMQIAKDLKVSGVRIFDLQIALIAFENGATELWTHDKNFVTIPGLRTIDPI